MGKRRKQGRQTVEGVGFFEKQNGTGHWFMAGNVCRSEQFGE